MAYLAVPEIRENDRNCVLPSEPSTDAVRYQATEKRVIDEVSGRDEKPVYLGRKNFRLLVETESTAGHQLLPIARILRDGAGNYVFDATFIPPLIDISASEALLMIVRRLSEMMEEKSRMLSGEVRSGSRFQQSFSPRDISTFWFLHAIHSAIPAFRHVFRTRRGHPELIYSEMARLAGASVRLARILILANCPCMITPTPSLRFIPWMSTSGVISSMSSRRMSFTSSSGRRSPISGLPR